MAILASSKKTSYNIKTEQFSGPFEVLLSLIEAKKLDIYSLSISSIINDYFNFLSACQEKKLELGSEFIMMASILISLKVSAMLPKDNIIENDSEIKTEKDLLDRLIVYKRFKELAFDLTQKEAFFNRVFFRDKLIKQYIKDNNIKKRLVFDNANKLDLASSFEAIASKEQGATKTAIIPEARAEKIRVLDKIKEIIAKINVSKLFSFLEIVKDKTNKLEVVASFLAVLEATKQQIIITKQNEPFTEIYIASKELES